MRNLSTEQTLLAALPILLVVIALVGAVVFFPATNLDDRSKAAPRREIVPKVTLKITPTPTPTRPISKQKLPEVVCVDLYSPVCGSDGQTYSNSCEANKAGVIIVGNDTCTTPTPASPNSRKLPDDPVIWPTITQ